MAEQHAQSNAAPPPVAATTAQDIFSSSIPQASAVSTAPASIKPLKSSKTVAISEGALAMEAGKHSSSDAAGALPHAKTLFSLASAEKLKKSAAGSTSTRSSVYETFGGNDTGKAPFSLPIGDVSAATFLAHCYEQLMKDSASIHSDGVFGPIVAPPQLPNSGILPAGTAPAALGKILMNQALDEPLTYVFIFTNPRSGNQQGRNLMDMALRNFRLRDRPEVQVQIYDVTDENSQKEGLHYLHQLQLRQGDRLLKTAFPELFNDFACGTLRVRPSPKMFSDRVEDQVYQQTAAGASTASPNNADAEAEAEADVNSNSSSWEEWITEAAAQLQSGLNGFTDAEIAERLERAQESAIKLHVWSAGGDGTVSATLEAMMLYGIDVGRLYFSCIPFGTGNDFADALGWGRSVPGNAVGESMKMLNKIITERLDGYTCKLDIYEITFTTYDDGHIKHVEKNMFEKPGMKRHKCLMIDYFSLGVQGFVGSSFELHRPGKRALNILMYTVAAAKWVFLKKFPPINEALESISTVPDHIMHDPKLTDADRAQWLEMASEAERRQVLLSRVAGPRKRSGGRKMTWTKEPKARRTATARDFGEGVDEDVPVIQNKPIEIDIQNVARFWGRNIDVWTRADQDCKRRGLSNTTGVTDERTWTPQYAGDGKVELFGVRNVGDYALNQMPGRKSYRITRLAQMESPLALHFREPKNYPPRSRNLLTDHKSIEQGLLYSMCDGEFIEMYHPRDIIITRKVTLKAVGRSPESSRIVLDTIKNDGLDAVQMDATASASRTHTGQQPDVSNYVSSPFMRIFGLGRNAHVDTTSDAQKVLGKGAAGSILEIKSQDANGSTTGNVSPTKPLSPSSSTRRSTFSSIRNSLFRSWPSSQPNVNGIKDSNSSSSSVASSKSNTFKSATISSPPQGFAPRRNQLATVHETSPLRLRQSLNDLRVSSTSPVADGLSSVKGASISSDLVMPSTNLVHSSRSKSLDLNHSYTYDGVTNSQTEVVAIPGKATDKVHGNDVSQDSMLSSGESSSTNSTASADENGEVELDFRSISGISEHSDEGSTMPNTRLVSTAATNGKRDSAQEPTTPVSPNHCLMILGKDLVDSLEAFTSPDHLLQAKR
ncbi:hypothetical protein GGI25_002897 [Coemansia spiralis]|uniref:DAGKc domain-containing protein n=1 Tax=Coemansia spiralis TaxID=417178 RepID=A0A9W8G7H5_9FUNG|nr:hypothetical protein GGI25_002897 [Coemansia spiralis]